MVAVELLKKISAVSKNDPPPPVQIGLNLFLYSYYW